MRSGALVASMLFLAGVFPVAAQQPVTLQFNDGLVTLQARNAPVRTILAEWARLGGATIVNGDRVAGPPVTLELTNVPERQALDVVLRSVAGYMLAPRRAGTVGESSFDRIMILPSSVAPRNPPPPAAAAGLRPGIPRPAVSAPVMIAPPPDAGADLPTDSTTEDAAADDQAVNPPGILPRTVPPTIVRPLPGADAQTDEPETDSPGAPSPGALVPTPSNPFGVPAGSSARPGVISPAPRPQPGQTNRVQ